MSDRQSLTAAAEVLVLHTLDYAGSRHRGRPDKGRLQHVPMYDTHLWKPVDHETAAFLVERAHSRSLTTAAAAMHGVHPSGLQQVVDAVAVTLLAGKLRLDPRVRAELDRAVAGL